MFVSYLSSLSAIAAPLSLHSLPAKYLLPLLAAAVSSIKNIQNYFLVDVSRWRDVSSPEDEAAW